MIQSKTNMRFRTKYMLTTSPTSFWYLPESARSFSFFDRTLAFNFILVSTCLRYNMLVSFKIFNAYFYVKLGIFALECITSIPRKHLQVMECLISNAIWSLSVMAMLSPMWIQMGSHQSFYQASVVEYEMDALIQRVVIIKNRRICFTLIHSKYLNNKASELCESCLEKLF